MVMNRPIEDVCEFADEIYWCDDWGEEPENEVDICRAVRNKLKMPLYYYRFMDTDICS